MANNTESRLPLYQTATTRVVDGERVEVTGTVLPSDDVELDYLNTNILNMNLSTVDTFTVTQATKYRPDLISLRFFGNYNMGWLISLHNGFIEGVFDYEVGVTVNIPSMNEYARFVNRNARV